MNADHMDGEQLEEPLAALERQFVAAYLADAGVDYHTLLARTDAEARGLLARAALYASERLSEIEARSQFLNELHGDS
jgi:hypothetical protein